MHNSVANKRIGFLVTGSEVTSGEILNSNSANMAQMLQEWGVNLGEHILCDDGADNIADILRFLLTRHEAVIISGGLGPTSDDVTRIAVSQVAGQDLVFNEASWQKIVERLAKRNLPIPENNRQQAMFPESATILRNDNGTADGCKLMIDNALVFMLPGPPRECMPLFEQQVFPMLKDQGFTSSFRLFRWRLMGISESAIAASLDPIAKEYKIEFAYRAGYPFVDIKLMLNPHHKYHSKILLSVEQIVKPYFATHLNELLTKQLHNLLVQTKRTLFVEDQATRGYFLQKMALSGEFIAPYKEQADIAVLIQGLSQYWNSNVNPEEVFDECFIEISIRNKIERYISPKILLRGTETLDFVAEFTALKILKML